MDSELAPGALLLVDDNEVFLHTLARALRRYGEPVLTARDPVEALACLDINPIGRAVLDLNLAGESGIQLMDKLLERAPHLQVVILTGYASIATAVEAVKRGACNYLCKPVTAGEVLTAFGSVPAPQADQPAETVPLSVKRLEWEHIQRVLAEHHGNISSAARALKMHRRTLQ